MLVFGTSYPLGDGRWVVARIVLRARSMISPREELMDSGQPEQSMNASEHAT